MSFARIRIAWRKDAAVAVLEDTPTTRALVAALPIKARFQTWGEEVYFEIPVTAKLEGTRGRSWRPEPSASGSRAAPSLCPGDARRYPKARTHAW